MGLGGPYISGSRPGETVAIARDTSKNKISQHLCLRTQRAHIEKKSVPWGFPVSSVTSEDWRLKFSFEPVLMLRTSAVPASGGTWMKAQTEWRWQWSRHHRVTQLQWEPLPCRMADTQCLVTPVMTPTPLSPEECGKHGFETSFDFCMCISISSSVQAQLLSVWARLGVLRTPSPWPSSVLVLLDHHPEWCALRDLTEAQRFLCVILPKCCNVLFLSVTITWWKNTGSKGSRLFFPSNCINYHSSYYPGLCLVSRHGLCGGVRLIPVKA